ncbi:DUF551 domain-containing protein [Caballeronia sp. ATUFL_M2_KS44]|uniref:DUF551 domain-containing protein n=1 Tax=Caballeronia sp. ATUFL_M2_KS44 TaxID=2921767 RepID=UPI0020294607|nr:DUF551 domain-containing protein [Caballeronia sp. ATUFL_M2_KS44]
MTFDQWFAEQYGDKREQLGLVVPELMRVAYEAAERQALERAAQICDKNAALLAGGPSNGHTALIVTADNIRDLIEQSAKGEAGMNGHELQAIFDTWSVHSKEHGEVITQENVSGFVQEVKKALASAPAQQWISVRDRLPAEGQPVMFVVASKYPDYNGRVFGGSFCMLADVPSFNTPGVGYRASHWMPLPEAPASSVASKEEPTS